MQGRINFLKGVIVGTVGSAFAFTLYNNYNTSDEKQHATAIADGGSDDYLHQRGKEILKYGVPDRGPDVRPYLNHVLCYDQAKKTPMWVAEHLTKADLKGSANRKYSHFKPDPSLDPSFSSHNSDYKSSGWSRGHMAPAGDNKINQDAMDETFYLSNILPQEFSNNAGFWNRMEIYCRNLTERFPEVRVISGPLMMANTEEGTKKFVRYEVIGSNSIAVPTHLFKVIVAESPQSSDGPVAIGAFVVPNQPIKSSAELKNYEVDIEEVEKFAGVHFLPDLPMSRRTDLCSLDSCELQSQESLELYFTKRKLEGAKTLERLESVWGQLEKKQLKPDEDLTNLYKKRRKDLSENS